ncbi:hypothetical protein M3697_06790 [Janibacter melonis]|uniref:hypothetical protein n=1 Tax=Janibacter melonis TaxID=262209 RepID=UPI002042CB5A|nr:hypothetical protein [Janibacter melonis]MCM3554811.1 hypothetical protein [Janibacter melonis]
MAGLALLVPVVGMAGLLTAMSSDGCTASKGNDALLGLGAPGSAAAFAAMATAALVRVRHATAVGPVDVVGAAGGGGRERGPLVLGAVMTASAVS